MFARLQGVIWILKAGTAGGCSGKLDALQYIYSKGSTSALVWPGLWRKKQPCPAAVAAQLWLFYVQSHLRQGCKVWQPRMPAVCV